MPRSNDGNGDPMRLLSLEDEGDGRYVGVCEDGTIGRVFGGQALAQALRAASLAVSDARPAHSLHAYFVSPGRAGDPIDYFVEPIKSGRSIDVADVRSRQHGRTLLSAMVSFHNGEPSDRFQLAMPGVTPPTALTSSRYVPPGTNPSVRAPFDIRYASSRTDGRLPRAAAEINSWVRTRAEIASDRQIDHSALLTYAIDFLLTRAAHVALGDRSPHIGASLDHSMWFHRPFRCDEWLLVSSEGISFAGSRSLCTANVFTRDGELVATASQEALIRMPPTAPDTAVGT